MFTNFFKCESGNVTVETALMALLISTIGLGSFELGRIFYGKAHLEQVVKAGVQFSLMGQTSANDATKIIAAATVAAGDSANDITITASTACECPGQGPIDCSDSCNDDSFSQMLVTVTAAQDINLVFSLPGYSASHLTATASVRVR